MPAIRKEVSSLVRVGPRFDASHGSRNHRFFEDLTRETLRGVGARVVSWLRPQGRYDADGPELARVGLGLRQAHGGRLGGRVRPMRPASQLGHGKRIGANV